MLLRLYFFWAALDCNNIETTFQTESSDDSILDKFSETQNSVVEQIISKNKNEIYIILI